MKIVCLVSDPFSAEMYKLIAKEAMRRGISFEIATDLKFNEDHMKRSNVPVFNPRKRLKGIRNEIEKLDLEQKQGLLEKEFGVSIGDLTDYDTVISRKSVGYQATTSLVYLLAWKEYFERALPQLVVAEDGHYTSYIACCVVARRCGIPIIYTGGGSIFPDYMIWARTNMFTSWVKKEYMEQELSDSEREKAWQYIKSTREEKPVIGFAPTSIYSFTPKRLLRTARYLSFLIRERSPYYPLSMKPFYLPTIRQRIAKKLYSQLDLDEKFIFFPLHVPDDTQIVLRVPHFVEQYKPVEMCAKNIPRGYTLYVKEHPHSKGAIPLSWLERMVLHPNVKLVPPNINAHDLIRNSCCVITINSDVGWEALLYGKPVVVLAQPFYSNLGLTFDVDCFSYSEVSHVTFDTDSEKRLPIKIKEALTQERIDEEKVLKLVNAIMKSVYPGSFYKSAGVFSFNCDADNIKNILDSILAEYSKLEKPQL